MSELNFKFKFCGWIVVDENVLVIRNIQLLCVHFKPNLTYSLQCHSNNDFNVNSQDCELPKLHV